MPRRRRRTNRQWIALEQAQRPTKAVRPTKVARNEPTKAARDGPTRAAQNGPTKAARPTKAAQNALEQAQWPTKAARSAPSKAARPTKAARNGPTKAARDGPTMAARKAARNGPTKALPKPAVVTAKPNAAMIMQTVVAMHIAVTGQANENRARQCRKESRRWWRGRSVMRMANENHCQSWGPSTLAPCSSLSSVENQVTGSRKGSHIAGRSARPGAAAIPRAY